MLIGCNPRDEAPVLNARIRKAWTTGAKVGVVGPKVDLTYDYYHAGDGPRRAVEDGGRGPRRRARQGYASSSSGRAR